MSKPVDTVYRCDPQRPYDVWSNERAIAHRLDLRRHSPDGLSWGYGGSGPAQAALAILADYLEDDLRALHLYQRFKWHVVAKVSQVEGGTITGHQIESFLRSCAMRSIDEVQRAHDMLVAVLLREVPIPLAEHDVPLITAAVDALCWVLHHEHNTTFQQNLKLVGDRLTAMGYEALKVEGTQ